MSEKGRSGKQLGDENVEKLRAYLERVEFIPARGNGPDKTAIARDAGLRDRQPLYKNENCVALLQEYLQKKPLGSGGAPDVPEAAADNPNEAKLERQLRTQEAKNDALAAEIFDLRRRLKRLSHIEALLEQGKRPIL